MLQRLNELLRPKLFPAGELALTADSDYLERDFLVCHGPVSARL